jgi:hypothetical protein
MNAKHFLASLFAAALVACSSGSEAAAPNNAAATKPDSNAATKTPTSATPEATGSSGPLVFTPQPGWTAEKPSSSMRKAQFMLPRADGDTEDASLVVFFFGGQGGSADANIERWAQQFEQPDGKSSSDVLVKSERSVNGMHVQDVELAGTYVAETSPGSGKHLRKEGWRMLASIIDAKEGPYYAKLVGPSATVKHWESSFRSFVSELKPGK